MAQHPTPDDAPLPEDSPVEDTSHEDAVEATTEPVPSTDEAQTADEPEEVEEVEEVEPGVAAPHEPGVEPEAPEPPVSSDDQVDDRADDTSDDPGVTGRLPDAAPAATPSTPEPVTAAVVQARYGPPAVTGAVEAVTASTGKTSAPTDAPVPGAEHAVGQDGTAEPQSSPHPRPTPQGRHEAAATPSAGSSGGWSKLGHAMRPQLTRSKLLAGLLCALLGFALAVQVSQTQEQQLSSLRQSDLVRLLDEVTQRANELEERVATLQSTRDELKSGSGQKQAALELAQKQSESQGILSGRLPAEGPGIELSIVEPGQPLTAPKMFNILEELRNAGAEVIEVNGVRLVTSSYFEDRDGGIVVDGQKITSPYRWTVIGDPSTLETALEIPGGAMATVRTAGAMPTITQEELVTVDATREPQAPQFATPVPAEDGS
ncbi:DUF881 domain-containing protein [Oerskovia sp. NPDC060338]|uniref:DUF881 domain-containing protein n=1 Tax=Oerskovia sp. NPDC060338 TaxID=3347100 RepID=UPI003654FC9F